MSEEIQRVVVIQDVSRHVSAGAIGWVLKGLSLKSGDVLTLLGILHQVNNPSTLSFKKAGELLGYRASVDSNSMFGANTTYVAEEVCRKTDEYRNNLEIMGIAKQCKNERIEFHIEVRAGPSKKTALRAAKSLRATWIILDRQMKKDKRYFMDNLSCGISRIKRDNSIENLREPKARGNGKMVVEAQMPKERVMYDEMIPGSPTKNISQKSTSPSKHSVSKEQDGDDEKETNLLLPSKTASLSKSSSSDQLTTTSVLTSRLGHAEASSSSFTDAKGSLMHFLDEEITTNTERETVEEKSPLFVAESQKRGQREASIIESPEEHPMKHNHNFEWLGGNPTDEVFKNSICSICKNRRPKVGWTKDFTYAELHAATEGFSPKNFLSEGGFGSVYRGELSGIKVAIKQHKNASFQGEKEFKSEVHVLSTARHENLVMLLGSCSEGNHRLLVYEYVCNGSLDQHLSKHTRRPLSWEKRMKIVKGAAKGLLYLHDNNIIHRDMRPSNILVTHDYASMLGDFGLARRGQSEDPDHSSETRVVGTLGYLAPEYAECGKVSRKTDVYSFGVVLLQMITGLKTTDKKFCGKSFVGWARPLLKERNYPDLIDERILDSHDVHQLFWMVQVAEKCLSKDPYKRLTMDNVVSALNYIMEGNTNCTIRELSPAQSDSLSRRDSPESHGDDSYPSMDSTSTSSTSHLMGKLPPSPSLQYFLSKDLSHIHLNEQRTTLTSITDHENSS